MVNRHQDADVIGEIQTGGLGTTVQGGFIITGASPDLQNSFAGPEAVKIQEINLKSTDTFPEHRFPKHSISWLEFKLTR